ncbi:MAG: ABC transporter ATP-binding protein [Proteobacteria bacterium]|jgi:iron complex transport system ATP-binding protein|nr:ABC transporter ATP-binding protein [Pseudomonadota bacterium]
MNGLEVNGISLDIDGAAILNNISCTVKSGEMVGLIGPNGAGKSSLLRSILGLVKIKAGTISLNDRNIADYALKERAKYLTYIAQGAPVHWPLTVEHIVGLGRVPHLNPWQRLNEEDKTIIEQALIKTDSISLRGRLVTTLSGGERARVLLARALATCAPYILADEPVASLDPLHQLQVMKILKDQSSKGDSVLVVLHDLGLALRYCDRIILLHEGEMIGQDTPDRILNDHNLANIFGIRASRWTDDGDDFLIAHHINKNKKV